jgi:hypothetical protein
MKTVRYEPGNRNHYSTYQGLKAAENVVNSCARFPLECGVVIQFSGGRRTELSRGGWAHGLEQS